MLLRRTLRSLFSNIKIIKAEQNEFKPFEQKNLLPDSQKVPNDLEEVPVSEIPDKNLRRLVEAQNQFVEAQQQDLVDHKNELNASESYNGLYNLTDKTILANLTFPTAYGYYASLTATVLPFLALDWQLWFGSYTYTTMGLTSLVGIYFGSIFASARTLNRRNIIHTINITEDNQYQIQYLNPKREMEVLTVKPEEFIFNISKEEASALENERLFPTSGFYCKTGTKVFLIPNLNYVNNANLRKLWM